MKVSRRDLSIIMFIIGIAAAFVVYQFYFTSALSNRESLVKETKSLQKELDELNEVASSQQTYETTIRSNTEKLAKQVSKYPAQYKYEDGIMYLYGLEHDTGYNAEFTSYTVVETAITQAYTGKVNAKERTFAFGNSTISTTFTVDSYENMKKLVNGIYNDEMPKNIETIQLTFDSSTGAISGNMVINMFSLTDGSNAYTPVEIPSVDMKVDNIFGPIVTPEAAPVVPEATE